MPPMTQSRLATRVDVVIAEPIASAASTRLSANISLTTPPHRKAVVGGALIEMAAMRRPERLAPCGAPEQRDGCIRRIVPCARSVTQIIWELRSAPHLYRPSPR